MSKRSGFRECWAVGLVTEAGNVRRVSPICFDRLKAVRYLQDWRKDNPGREYQLFMTSGWQEVRDERD